MKAKLDTWINFKTTKEQKAQIESQAALCDISQSEFIREAVDCSIGGCEPTINSKETKTYNFALTKDEIKLLIMATSRAYGSPSLVFHTDVRKLCGVFVRALESIEKGGAE